VLTVRNRIIDGFRISLQAAGIDFETYSFEKHFKHEY